MTTYGPANINPADWTYIGNFYQGNSEDMYDAYRNDHEYLNRAIGDDWDAKVTRHANGGCGSCGTHYAHGVIFRWNLGGQQIPNDRETYLAVGHICGNDLFALPNIAAKDMARAKKAAKNAEAKRQARAEASEFIEAHTGLLEALQLDHFITQDIAAKLWQYGSISEKQIELLHNLVAQEGEREERQAKDAALNELATAAPEGRIEGLHFEVLSTRTDETMYGSQEKMLVRNIEGGWKAWGSVPSALGYELDKGDNITFAAAFTPSDDDPKFAFYKRPTKAARA